MNPELLQSLSVLAVGMITVFSILGLVVLTGQTLIRIVNRMTPDPAPATPAVKSAISKGKLTAIVATVDIVTEGKGKITKIEKI